MQDDEEGCLAEFEVSGESELRDRLYRGSGMHPEAKFHYASRRERADFKKSRCAAMCGERYGPRSPLCLWASWGSGSPYFADPSAF
jgi:hypothetical protein